MDAAGKIAAGVVLGALVIVAGFVGYREFSRQREAAELVRYEREHPLPKVTAADVWVDATPARRPASRPAPRPSLLPLRADERCLGGTVVRVSGSSYTQAIGPDGRPVGCSGR